MLLTGHDLRDQSSQFPLLNTMNSLLRMKVVPVLNGNDVVAPDPAKHDNVSHAPKKISLPYVLSKSYL